MKNINKFLKVISHYLYLLVVGFAIYLTHLDTSELRLKFAVKHARFAVVEATCCVSC